MKASLQKTYFSWLCRLSLIGAIVAFIGISLWIFSLTGAVSLPKWVVAIWWIVDIVLVLYVLLHWSLYMVDAWTDEMVGPALGMPLLYLVISGICVGFGGPGCGSLLVFLPLVAMTMLDVHMLHHGDDQQQQPKQAPEQIMQQ